MFAIYVSMMWIAISPIPIFINLGPGHILNLLISIALSAVLFIVNGMIIYYLYVSDDVNKFFK